MAEAATGSKNAKFEWALEAVCNTPWEEGHPKRHVVETVFIDPSNGTLTQWCKQRGESATPTLEDTVSALHTDVVSMLDSFLVENMEHNASEVYAVLYGSDGSVQVRSRGGNEAKDLACCCCCSYAHCAEAVGECVPLHEMVYFALPACFSMWTNEEGWRR